MGISKYLRELACNPRDINGDRQNGKSRKEPFHSPFFLAGPDTGINFRNADR